MPDSISPVPAGAPWFLSLPACDGTRRVLYCGFQETMKWLRLFLYFAAAVVVFVTATSVTIGFLLRDESTVACPDVTGLDVDEARGVVAHKGLSLAVTKYEKKKDVPYDRILAQVPDRPYP